MVKSCPQSWELSDAFHLAPETIRAALLILAEDGYIRMEAKQGSWVTYQADRAAREEAVARYYAQRCDGIQDLRRSAPYLLEPLLTHALREMDDSCRTRLRENWEAGRKDQIISPAIRLCALLLSVLNNSLILNLFWEVDRYLRFSCLSVSDAYDAVASAMFQNDRDNEAGRSDKVLYDAGGTIRQIIGICHEARGVTRGRSRSRSTGTIYRGSGASSAIRWRPGSSGKFRRESIPLGATCRRCRRWRRSWTSLYAPCAVRSVF